jgi:hypothetical protein
LRTGRPRCSDEEFAKIEQSGARFQVPDLSRLKGEAILMSDCSVRGAAEDCFRKAIELSANTGSCTPRTRLARLLSDTIRRDEGREMLAKIYAWFTEGFKTSAT